MNRRDFLKISSLTALAATVGAQVVTFGKKAWAQAVALALVDMSKKKRTDAENAKAVGILQGLGYVEDADAAEKAKKITRVDKPHPGGGTMSAKKQYCNNCAFYAEDAKIDKKEHSKCKIVPAEVQVHFSGYCNTYNVHPKSKV